MQRSSRAKMASFLPAELVARLSALLARITCALIVFCAAILEWLNTTFSFHITKIEETASGAVACQILDSIFPGEVPMSKVRWDAKSSHEFVGNYKIIQQVFEKRGIDRVSPLFAWPPLAMV
jgi:hypothetical protein